jgi:hypothetical protein
MTDDNYKVEFEDMPEEIGSGEVAEILNVAGIQGVHHVIFKWLPKQPDAPAIDVKKIQFGKRTYNRYQKQQIIELRRYRDGKAS